ncbi:endonuclease III [Paramagnetospirillum marisnigri]|uniref:Endonuclease III n=1 Tax=Paramagnetospirillum marisnigri TaxID=1285242 RepID=A0A178MLJ5_9PROT|nr:GIY-YIG nuclease family protein [Paramagnetospirillum marisnigri]OAN49413.1 endonuclease III [Paramagnetospirillum marisnigri]
MTDDQKGIAAEFYADVTGLPAEPGAYVLLIQLADSLPVKLVGRPEVILAPGHFLYCGSARGPGGIKARVGRHMQKDKTVRWHVDRLTTTGMVLGAWVFPGGDECELVGMLTEMPVPIPGFGSSDCETCVSHLLAWPPGMVLPFDSRSN